MVKGTKRSSFSSSLYLSVLFHILIIFILCFSQSPQVTSKSRSYAKDYKAFLKAFEAVGNNIGEGELLNDLFSMMEEEDIIRVLGGKEALELDLNNEEKIEFYKKLIVAFLQLKQRKLKLDPNADVDMDDIRSFLRSEGEFELSTGDKVFPSKPDFEGSGLSFKTLAKEKKDKLDYFRRNENLEKERYYILNNQVRVETEEGIKYIPEEFYFRNCPYEEIMAQGAGLFYIMEGFPILKEGGSSSERAGNPAAPQSFSRSWDDIVVIFLSGETEEPGFQKPLIEKKKEILRFPKNSEERLNKVFDGLMSFQEDDQFYYIKEKYMDKYDPDEGDLAGFIRKFVHNNLSSVIVIINDISGAFSFMEELYFSKGLDSRFAQYWRKNPWTKTGVEFLFILASHYNFEKRGLTYLFNAHKEARRIIRTRFTRPDVYNKQAKAYVINEVYNDLMNRLGKLGYDSKEDVLAKYWEEQEKIYQMIIDMGGREKNRAYYALGCAHWEEKQHQKAISIWKRIDSTYSNKTFREIKIILNNYQNLQDIISRLNTIFDWESDKNGKELLERLLKYHKWKIREKKKESKV
jgi:hypothetical protein